MPNGELQSFFRFLVGAEDGTAVSGRLAAMVRDAKSNGQWRQQFMTWEQEMKEQARDLAKELAQEMAQELAQEIAQERAQELAQKRAEEIAQEIAEEAVKEATAQNVVETAKKMLDKDIAMGIIAEVTGLPLAQVEQLQQENTAQS